MATAESGAASVEVGGRIVRVTHPDRGEREGIAEPPEPART